MKNGIPLTGPGSQPTEDDAGDFAFMEMPKGMNAYAPPEMPEPEEAKAFRPALDKLEAVLSALRSAPAAGASIEIDLSDLDAANRGFMDQMLGEGEVSIIAGGAIQAQEAILAGVWRVHTVDAGGALDRRHRRGGRIPAKRFEGRTGRGGANPSGRGGRSGGRSHECARSCFGACPQTCGL